MANGNQGMQTEKYKDATDADFLWEYDMIKELNVFPHNMSACSPLIVGDIIFIVTANGVDETHINIPAPEAPSFIALDKKSGKLLWKSNIPGSNIMHGQWSNPVLREINGVKQVIFPGGDGWLYSFTPEKGELIWKFDCNPKNAVYETGGTGTRNDFIGTPVVYDNKVYIGVGQDPEHTTGIAAFYCIAPDQEGGHLQVPDREGQGRRRQGKDRREAEPELVRGLALRRRRGCASGRSATSSSAARCRPPASSTTSSTSPNCTATCTASTPRPASTTGNSTQGVDLGLALLRRRQDPSL